MAIRRFSTADLTGRKGSSMVGGYGWGWSEMDSLQTVTVGAGGAASIEFSSIPQTYQHLQIRHMSRGTASAAFAGGRMRINGVTAASYARHQLYGDGASATAVGQSSNTEMFVGSTSAATATANIFGGVIIDILDYAVASKNRVIRVLAGVDLNGSGLVHLDSGLLVSTSAVTSVQLFLSAGNFAQFSQAALYGIKG